MRDRLRALVLFRVGCCVILQTKLTHLPKRDRSIWRSRVWRWRCWKT